jgi:hypothetical protein
MAIITDTYQTSSAQGKQNRETIIRNTIENIDPSETPFYSSLSRAPGIEGIKPEWVQDSLAAPSITNAQVEGDQYVYTAVTQPVRIGNYTQISRKPFIVSKTQDVVSKVGPATEVGRNMARVGMELLTDIEASFLSNNASVGGLTRYSAGLRAWTATCDVFSAGGASGGYNAGTGVVDAATNGTAQRAFTKELMDQALLACYNAGGKPTQCHLSPYAKSVFSTFMSDANVAQQRMTTSPRAQATIVGAADAYLSDWGLIDFIPNRQMPRIGADAAAHTEASRNVYFITPSMLEKGFLRDIAEDRDIAPNADATARVIICEFTLVNRNEKAHAVVADIFGMSAAA